MNSTRIIFLFWALIAIVQVAMAIDKVLETEDKMDTNDRKSGQELDKLSPILMAPLLLNLLANSISMFLANMSTKLPTQPTKPGGLWGLKKPNFQFPWGLGNPGPLPITPLLPQGIGKPSKLPTISEAIEAVLPPLLPVNPEENKPFLQPLVPVDLLSNLSTAFENILSPINQAEFGENGMTENSGLLPTLSGHFENILPPILPVGTSENNPIIASILPTETSTEHPGLLPTISETLENLVPPLIPISSTINPLETLVPLILPIGPAETVTLKPPLLPLETENTGSGQTSLMSSLTGTVDNVVKPIGGAVENILKPITGTVGNILSPLLPSRTTNSNSTLPKPSLF